ncbi:MAG TPA: hypothetical protein ENK18_25110 [Deltaproteobacteria bacterium]|nr:hypothetical protein [Deltaproteobacteria bacterium]
MPASLLLALLCGCGGPEPATSPPPIVAPLLQPEPAQRPHNLLIIVADDLGTDKVGAYGEHPTPPLTPHLDQLAASGILFRNAYAYPTGSASRAALLTGRYGRRTGMGGLVELDRSTYELPLAEVLLPEVLGRSTEHTWSTAALGKWHLSSRRSEHALVHPNLQGFDHYAGSLGNLRSPGATGDPDDGFEKVIDGHPGHTTAYPTRDTTDDAIGQLELLEPPWLLYVAYNAPRSPLQPPPDELRSQNIPDPPPREIERFNATVEALDREIGRLLGAMTPEQRRTTTVIFLADNGTDRSVILPPREPEHGKASLYEGGTNVPLIVSGPQVQPGAEAWALVHVVDVLPTVAQLAGVDVSDLVLDGVSFAPLLSDPSQDGPRHTVFTERFGPPGGGPYDIDQIALRNERYKIMQARRGGWWLFDLQGRFVDGEPHPASALEGEERAQYEVLRSDLDTLMDTLSFAH